MNDAVELLGQLRSCDISVSVDKDELVLRPASKVPPELLTEVRKHKHELVELLSSDHGYRRRYRRCIEFVDLPWPVGYGGLPVDEVVKAEAQNDRLGVTDPVYRRLNVLSWMRCFYREKGEMEMARPEGDAWAGAGNSGLLRSSGGSYPMRLGQLSESDAGDALVSCDYSSRRPRGSNVQGNQFDRGNTGWYNRAIN